MQNYECENYLSLPALEGATSISANSLVLMARCSSFPPPVQMDGNDVWIASEIADWIQVHLPCSFFTLGAAA